LGRFFHQVRIILQGDFVSMSGPMQENSEQEFDQPNLEGPPPGDQDEEAQVARGDEASPESDGLGESPPEEMTAGDAEQAPFSTHGRIELDLDLVEPKLTYWDTCDPAARKRYVEQTEKFYRGMLGRILKDAEACTALYHKLVAAHVRGRTRLIWATGGVAVLNAVTAYAVGFSKEYSESWLFYLLAVLPLVGAVWAGIVAILSNLESFHQRAERAQTYRDSRELFLDVRRRFESLWICYVKAFSRDSPQACRNAAVLYRALVEEERRLRHQVQDVAETSIPGAGQGGQAADTA